MKSPEPISHKTDDRGRARTTSDPAPWAEDAGARRAYAANILGTLALTIADRLRIGTEHAAGRGAHAPAALVTLLWYPDRPIAFLADRLRITHPGAVQLVDRLSADGLAERVPALDGRTKLLALTADGESAALRVLAERRGVLDRALESVEDGQVDALARAVEAMLEALADSLLTSEYMCRMCDERACPDARCPVERAEPAPAHRRGIGYGVSERT